MIRLEISGKAYIAFEVNGKALRTLRNAKKAIENAEKRGTDPDDAEIALKWCEIVFGEQLKGVCTAEELIDKSAEVMEQAINDLTESILPEPEPETGENEPEKGGGMSLEAFTEALYTGLMDQGWTMPEIDRTDIAGYVRMMIGKPEKEVPRRYIDQVPFSFCQY